MNTVLIKERYTLPFGKIIVIEPSNEIIHVGEQVRGNDGASYEVKGIVMPTRPGRDVIGIVYEYSESNTGKSNGK